MSSETIETTENINYEDYIPREERAVKLKDLAFFKKIQDEYNRKIYMPKNAKIQDADLSYTYEGLTDEEIDEVFREVDVNKSKD